ncbi:hypothetical protein [Burkholderia phage FLC8]|nr:hypothetical protein [Burkholderia phage FLC8]
MNPVVNKPNEKDKPVNPGPAIQWKNSLLLKEDPEPLQNPLIFFGKLIMDSDTFSTIYEDILKAREQGEYLEYLDKDTNKIRNLCAFMVIQDQRGSNWICPVHTDSDPIDQKVCPLNFASESDDSVVRTTECFGTMIMSMDDYISACSRGFENASRLLLGNQSIKLDKDCRLLAIFYLFPKQK